MSRTATPKIIAKLHVDEHGDPAVVEAGDKKHFRISFEVQDSPSNAYAATFELDPKTYYDPIRTLRPDSNGQFHLDTTTYGDYDVRVTLRTEDGRDQLIQATVSSALEETIEPTANASVAEALSYIAKH